MRCTDLVLVFSSIALATQEGFGNNDAEISYGTDVVSSLPFSFLSRIHFHFSTAQHCTRISLQSFAMHYPEVSTNYAWLPHNRDPSIPIPEQFAYMPIQPLGERAQFYKDYIQGCVDYYGEHGDRCQHNENVRLAMCRRQPQSMNNYTKTGFTKIRAPDDVYQMLKEFWDKNRDKAKNERWARG